MIIDTNWYVITGGPSSGKSKMLDRLAFLGYSIVPEAARIYIDDERSKGRTTEEIRADEAEFQKIVLNMKIDKEAKLSPKDIIFLERGMPDSVAYYQICGADIEPVILASQDRRYKGIFLLDQAPFEKDYARTEDEKQAKRISRLLNNAYRRFNYDVIRVPILGSIEERANYILNRIEPALLHK